MANVQYLPDPEAGCGSKSVRAVQRRGRRPESFRDAGKGIASRDSIGPIQLTVAFTLGRQLLKRSLEVGMRARRHAQRVISR
jgi:hypothetical protein